MDLSLNRALSCFMAIFGSAAVTLTAASVCSPARGETQADTVGSASRHYVDDHRQNWAKTGPRPLETTLWYPAPPSDEAHPPVEPQNSPFVLGPVQPDAPLDPKRDRYPLIVISHGTGGCAAALLWMGRYLAAHGYIVAAVNHHGNTCTEPGDPRGYLLWWERPQDLTAVLDKLLADPVLGPHIDRQKIGALGFSLGGYSVITLSGGRIDLVRYHRFCDSPARDFTCGPQPEFPEAPARFHALEASDPAVQEALKHSGDSYLDRRVRAAFAMAPVFASGFAREDLADIKIPVEIVVGAGDKIAPPKTNAERFADLIPKARLVEFPGQVGHYDFLPVCTDIGRKMLPERLCQAAPGVDRARIHEQAQYLALQFFNRALGAQQ